MRVKSATHVTRFYDADTRTIIIPANLSPSLTQRAIQAAVAELHLPCEHGTPLCFCGQPLTLGGHIPTQRTSEETNDGA
jgi:hypothetical protein